MKAVSDARLHELVQALAPDGGSHVAMLDARDTAALAAAATTLDGREMLAVRGRPGAVRAAGGLLETQGLVCRLTLASTSRGLLRVLRGDATAVADQLGLTARAAGAAKHLPAAMTTAALTSRAPAIALFTRAGAPPPLAWLSDHAADGAIAALTGHRGETVSLRTSRGGTADGLFAKWATSPPGVERLRREAAARQSLGPDARAAGFDIPPVREVELPGAFALVSDARVGSTAAALLRSRPSELPRLTDRICSTVEAWNLRTAVVKPFADSTAARRLEDDLQALGPQIDGARARRLAGEAAAIATPVAPAHGDLTMVNVVAGPSELTLVDWEAALDEELPGFDVEYALVDAAAAAGGYRDRVEAAGTAGVERWRERIEATLGVPAPVARLAPIACWAHHAANELRAGGSDRSFLTLLRLALGEGAH